MTESTAQILNAVLSILFQQQQDKTMKNSYPMILLILGLFGACMAFAMTGFWFKLIGAMVVSICFTLIAAKLFAINDETE